MTRAKGLLLVVGVALFLGCATAKPPPIAPKETILDFILQDYSIDWDYNEFFDLCATIQGACGFEVAAGDEKFACGEDVPPDKETFEYPGPVTVREVLDKIVERRTRYRWVYDRGVINLLPKPGEGLSEEGLAPGGRNPLDRVIKDLSFKGMRAQLAADVILVASSVDAKWMPSSKLTDFKELDLHLREITARNSLNEVARADGKVMWIFCRNPYSLEWAKGIYGWRSSPLR